MDSWVLCPCQRSRLPLLKRLLTSLDHPADRVVVVTTLPDPIDHWDIPGFSEHIVVCRLAEASISHWWNVGLNYIADQAQERHEVLTVSSDYVGTPYSVAMLGVFLRKHRLTMVGPNHHSEEVRLFNLVDHRTATTRVQGGCWMLAGESRLRCDEAFRWWYSDDDLEMQARRHSGTGILPGTGLKPEPDTPLSPEKLRWAEEDRVKFVVKWGKQPW